MDNSEFFSSGFQRARLRSDLDLKIAIFMAIPEEFSPFLKLLGYKIRRLSTIFVTRFHNKQLFLLPTGMGLNNFWLTLAQSIPELRPDLMISCGFCGELTLCNELDTLYIPVFSYAYPFNSSFPGLKLTVPSDIFKHLSQVVKLKLVESISTPVYIPKSRITPVNPPAPAIVDMETYYLAFASYILKVPFISFRAVTDRRNDEILFDVNRIINRKGFVSIPRVMALIFRKPQILQNMLFYRKRALFSADLLARALLEFLSLPNETVRLLEPPNKLPY